MLSAWVIANALGVCVAPSITQLQIAQTNESFRMCWYAESQHRVTSTPFECPAVHYAAHWRVAATHTYLSSPLNLSFHSQHVCFSRPEDRRANHERKEVYKTTQCEVDTSLARVGCKNTAPPKTGTSDGLNCWSETHEGILLPLSRSTNLLGTLS